MASLADILTTQKNGVVAINGLVSSLTTLNNNLGTPALLARSAATTSYSTLYTSDTGINTYITDVTICNTGSSSITVYVSFVPSGGTAGASNAVFYNTPIPAYSTLQWTGIQLLNSGGTIQAYASSTSCTFSISGGVS